MESIEKPNLPYSNKPPNKKRQTHQNSNKIWTEEEDQLLLSLSIKYKNNKKKWKLISKILSSKSPKQCFGRFSRINTNLNKGKWSKEEDRQIIELIRKYDFKWAIISREMNRSPKQVRERYENHLNNNLNFEKFSIEEDDELIRLINRYGNKWSYISKYYMTNRSPLSLKNRYYCIRIKKIKRRKYFYISKTSQSQRKDNKYNKSKELISDISVNLINNNSNYSINSINHYSTIYSNNINNLDSKADSLKLNDDQFT